MVSSRTPLQLIIAVAVAAILAGCPLPFEFNGKDAGAAHSSDPSSPNMTAPVTVSYAEQGGTSGSIADGSSFVSGKTTTVTLATVNLNAVIFYTDDGSALTDLRSAKKINASSGTLTITRTTTPQSLDIHAVAVGSNMLPSPAVHVTVGISPYPILSITRDNASISEDGGTATFTITSSSAPAGDIAVTLQTGGTYDPVVELPALQAPGTTFPMTLKAGTTTVSIPVTAHHDTNIVNETVSLTIEPDVGTPPSYTVGTPAAASLVIQDDYGLTVTYNGNGHTGGTVPVDNNGYPTGTPFTVLGSGSLLKTGYVFVAWNTQADRSGTTYNPSQVVSMGSANVTLYAIWAPIITTVAGMGTSGYSGDNGPATSAQISFPWGIAVDSSGNIYFSDSFNNRIRKVSTNGTITTIAGDGIGAYLGDGGPATSAEVNHSSGVALDASGNLYIADSYNLRVRKISTSGIITTIGGPWFEPMGVATDTSYLYVSDYGSQVWKVPIAGGTPSLVAGNGTQGFSGDGGPATTAELNDPWGVAVDASGNVYIADQYNGRIRKVSTSGIITTVAGNGGFGFSGDGGPATGAALNNPEGIAVDTAGNFYIADVSNFRIRKVSTSGTITTVAGNGVLSYSGDGVAATSASVGAPRGATIDASGNLYIADSTNDRIRKVSPPLP